MKPVFRKYLSLFLLLTYLFNAGGIGVSLTHAQHEKSCIALLKAPGKKHISASADCHCGYQLATAVCEVSVPPELPSVHNSEFTPEFFQLSLCLKQSELYFRSSRAPPYLS